MNQKFSGKFNILHVVTFGSALEKNYTFSKLMKSK